MANPKQDRATEHQENMPRERRRMDVREADRSALDTSEGPRREQISEIDRRRQKANELRMKNRIRSRKR